MKLRIDRCPVCLSKRDRITMDRRGVLGGHNPLQDIRYEFECGAEINEHRCGIRLHIREREWREKCPRATEVAIALRGAEQ